MADTWFEAEINEYMDKTWSYAKGVDYNIHAFYGRAVMLIVSIRFLALICELLFMSIVAEFFALYQNKFKAIQLKTILNALKKDALKILTAGLIWVTIYFFCYGLAAVIYLRCIEVGASSVVLVGSLASIVFIVVGFQLEYMLAAAVQISIIEQLSPFQAIKRSAKLMFPYFWTTWIIFIVLRILFFLSIYIFLLPMIVSGFMAEYFGGLPNAEDSVVFIIATMIGMFLYYLISGFYYMFTGVHYYNLVERKDGTGMKERIASLGKQDQQTDIELYY